MAFHNIQPGLFFSFKTKSISPENEGPAPSSSRTELVTLKSKSEISKTTDENRKKKKKNHWHPTILFGGGSNQQGEYRVTRLNKNLAL